MLPAVWALLGLAWLAIAGWHGAVFTPLFGGPSASADGLDQTEAVAQRRQVLGAAGLAVGLPATPALAYESFKDTNFGFEFRYPTGLQKSESQLYNVFLRDIIEPLESIGVRVTDTSRKSLNEVGSASEVAEKLMADVVPAKAPREIISSVSKTDSKGRRYDVVEYRYQWKFDDGLATQVGRKRFQLHCKALVTVANKKQYLVVTGVEEPRWEVQGDQLGLAVDTFKLYF